MKDLFSLSHYRALLGPIRFGAGIKGKICDSWFYGTPSVTTPIGAEGMFLKTYNDILENGNNESGAKNEELTKKDKKYYFEGDVRKYYKYEEPYKNDIFGFGGSFLNYSEENFVANAVKIYEDKEYWQESTEIGYKIIQKRMSFLKNESLLIKRISEGYNQLSFDRKNNFFQALLWSETLRSTEFMNKYVNLLNMKKKLIE